MADFFSLRVRPWGLLKTAGCVILICSLLGFFGRYSWFADLMAHFRVQYSLGLLVLALIFAVSKRRLWAIILACGIIPNLIVIFPYCISGSTQPINPRGYKALLINVNTQTGDPVRVNQCVRDLDPDFVLFEEISSRWQNSLKALHDQYPYRIELPREDNFGMAFYTKHEPLNMKFIVIGAAGVPSVLAQFELDGNQLTILGTHPVPPAGAQYSKWRNEQLSQIPSVLADFSGARLVLGDLNATPWSYQYKMLLAQTGLNDTIIGYGLQMTWPSYMPLLWIPIDHCLVSDGIIVLDRDVHSSAGSDHYPLSVDFGFRR